MGEFEQGVILAHAQERNNIFLPGTGKTTTSKWLHNILDASIFTENSLNYPNDFSSIAGMTTETYNTLSNRFPLLYKFLFEYGSIKYVNIQNIELQHPYEKELIRLLYQWDIGDEFNTNVSVSHYMTCSLGSINRRVDTIIRSVEFASDVKGASWTYRVAELISKTIYGIAHNLHGMDGMVQYFTLRKQIEDKILSKGIMWHEEYFIGSNNWDQIHEQIRKDFSV